MNNNRSFNELLQSLYLVSSGLEDINEFLQKSGVIFNSHLVACMQTNALDASFRSPFSIGLSDRDLDNYRNYYADKNILIKACLPKLVQGKVALGSDHFSDSELLKTEYYADFLKNVGAFHNMGFMFTLQNDWVSVLLVSRPKTADDYSANDTQLFQVLRTHFVAAMQINTHLNALKSECKSKTSALDHLNTGVCFLASNLKIIEANLAAKNTLDGGQFLSSRFGFMTTGHNSPVCVYKLLHEMSNGALISNQQVRVSNKKNNADYFLSVFPINDPDTFWWVDSKLARYVVFIETQLHLSERSKLFMRNEFDLTHREITVVELLIGGKSLSQAAKFLEISHETTRSHMKNVFGKMDIHSQPQLAVIVSRLNTVC